MKSHLSFVLGGALAAVLLQTHPAPAQTAGPAPAASPKAEQAPPPFEVTRVGAHAWVGRFGTSNCEWVELGGAVLLIDSGGTERDARNLESQIKETTKGKPVRWVVLSHLHGHANSGLPVFLRGGATILVNASIAKGVSERLGFRPGQEPPKVVGIADSHVVSGGDLKVEIFAPKGPACTGADLWAFFPDSGLAIVADLVTPRRCPLLIDPSCDPAAWVAELARIGGTKPSALVGSYGDITREPDVELKVTGAYLGRILSAVREVRSKNLPSARLASELSIVQNVGDYCPRTLDIDNGLAIYRRMGSDGTLGKAVLPGTNP